MADLLERSNKRKRDANKPSGERWAKLNQFVDLTMRDLKPAKQSVWFWLFRHERNGTVEASIRQIAKGAGLSLSGAQLAMKMLTKAGLVEVLLLSKSHDRGSLYRTRPTRKDV